MAQSNSVTAAPPTGGKKMALGEMIGIVLSLVGAFLALFIASRAYTAAYEFHMFVFALAGFGSAFFIFKRHSSMTYSGTVPVSRAVSSPAAHEPARVQSAIAVPQCSDRRRSATLR